VSTDEAVIVTELECDHCGDVAIESATGLFGDGDGEACLSCGMPGCVSIDDAGDIEDNVAYWRCDDEARCTLADCSECREERDQ
jgi:hypothetical protein